jgi:hypothetical protein
LAITISVFSDAKLGQAELLQAERRASRILADAGVDVIWLNCDQRPRLPITEEPAPGACSAIRFPDHLSVRVVGRPLAAGPGTFGHSFLDASGQGCYADIYRQSFESVGSGVALKDAEMLGHVIAHETGHLLLGLNSHSESGLMQAHWGRNALLEAAKGNLRFTRAQAVAMRQRLSASGASFGQRAGGFPASRGN